MSEESGHLEVVEHESSISRFSPFLFLSLLLLTWNLIFTLVGVAENKNDPLANEVVQSKMQLYIWSLVAFPLVCGGCLILKCSFSGYFQKRTRHWWKKLADAAMYDVIFVIMGTLYLAGDNLPIFICSSRNDTDAKEACRGRSSIILGVSLLLHTALYLAGILNLKSTPTPAYPIKGRIRKAYESVLQLGKLTLFLDQTFTTVVRFATHLDIEDDETLNCGCIDKFNTTDCLSTLNGEVGGFFGSLFAIILFIVIRLIIKNLKDYCSCCWKKMKLKDCHDWCHCHFWENVLIITIHIFAIVFMALYTLADNRWLWRCVIPEDTSFGGRIALLSVSLSFTVVMHLVYIVIICLPGVGIVWGKKRLLSEHKYAVITAERKKSEWECTRAFGPSAVNEPSENSRSCCNCSANGTNQIEDAGNRDREYFLLPSTQDEDSPSQTAPIGELTVEENYGSASISLSFEEEITCRKAIKLIHEADLCSACSGCNCTCKTSPAECKKCLKVWKNCASLVCCIFTYCTKDVKVDEETTCLECCCPCWDKWKDCCTCACMLGCCCIEEEETSLIAYVGNENKDSDILVTLPDARLELLQTVTYPVGTKILIIKPNESPKQAGLQTGLEEEAWGHVGINTDPRHQQTPAQRYQLKVVPIRHIAQRATHVRSESIPVRATIEEPTEFGQSPPSS